MDKATFLQSLAQDQFPEPVLVVRDPGSMDEHSHPFESKALILEGSLCLTIKGMTKEYTAGEVFHLMYQENHSESYGPKGVQYLVSRKEK